ncbi:MAG TPA: hypothetical protein VKV03_15810 [Candidatus Binataceae bacterium]|nr:hypothetical protein [Candidatus Binataceae bacterium]
MKRIALVASILAIASAAHAAEPRPWLCRDKPVFSSQQPMSYRVTMTSRSRWQVFLMQFSPGGGHDGFDIAQTISRGATGQLAAGRYFAVALRNSGGNWICPPAVSEEPTRGGTITDLCFGTDEGACSVELVVTSGGIPSK